MRVVEERTTVTPALVVWRGLFTCLRDRLFPVLILIYLAINSLRPVGGRVAHTAALRECCPPCRKPKAGCVDTLMHTFALEPDR